MSENVLHFNLYKEKNGVTMNADRKNYYMGLLEGRAQRLNNLIKVAAPSDIICQEVLLLMQAAVPLEPSFFKSWVGKYSWPCSAKESEENEGGYKLKKCATG